MVIEGKIEMVLDAELVVVESSFAVIFVRKLKVIAYAEKVVRQVGRLIIGSFNGLTVVGMILDREVDFAGSKAKFFIMMPSFFQILNLLSLFICIFLYLCQVFQNSQHKCQV